MPSLARSAPFTDKKSQIDFSIRVTYNVNSLRTTCDLMRIGYDAKRAFNNTTGLGNYSRTLIRGIERNCPHWKLFLFTPHRKLPFASQGEVMTPKGLGAKTFHSLWRSHWSARKISSLKLDLYHGLSQEIPYNLHRKLKTIVTIHDLLPLLRPREFNWPDRALYALKLRHATRKAHHVLTFSQDTKNNLMNYLKVSEQKITILPQSCHSAFLRTYSSQDIAHCCKKFSLSRPFLHFVGSFIPRKRPWQSLLAFQQVASSLDVDFVMIGQGPEKKRCQQFVAEKNLGERVHFLSPASTEEMAMLCQASELLLYPSVAEGFGIPLLEAHFSQTAVMTSLHSCLPEVAGPHAYYADPDRPGELASKLRAALKNPAERSAKGERSRHWAQNFTPEKVTKKLIRYYRSLV